MSGESNEAGVFNSETLFVQGNAYHVEIPADERQEDTEPESDALGRVRDKPFDLNGKTLQEVQSEAARITLGEVFQSFSQFDRCIDSWGVMNHRAVARYKTSKNICIRNCRFGLQPTTRTSISPKRKSEFFPTDSNRDDLHLSVADNNELSLSPQTQVHSSHFSSQNSQCDKENCGTRSSMSQQQVDDLVFENGLRQMSRTARARAPLAELPSNRPRESLQPGSQQQIEKRPPSLVRHTSEWLPGRQSLIPLPTGHKVTRRSKTGACGELARWPSNEDDDQEGLFIANRCPWYVRVICRARTGTITITKCNLTHTCPQHLHAWRGPTSKAHWLGETLAPRVTRHLKGPVKELSLGFQQDYRRTANYKQMWQAKDLVRDAYLGGQRRSFHCIPGLIEKLKRVDPGCKATWEASPGSDVFERAFICPSACRKALAYTQPVVCLDACHTKNRKYPTQIFLATVLDGNMEVLPLAFAVAPTENFENWKWFLEFLDGAITDIDQVHVPLMSDRCKGLIAAVKEVFPGKVHGMCANHLRANVKKEFGKVAEGFFLATVYANTNELFVEILDRLERSTAKGIAAASYIRELDARLYARHAFPLPRFGHVTSNPCEQTNSGLLTIREFAPFKLLVEMWYYIQGHFNTSRRRATECGEILTPPAHLRHSLNLETYGQYQVFDDCGGRAKVQTTTGTEQHLVQLGERPTCTCFELQEMCWPCPHIMAWDDVQARPFTPRFHACWRTSNWRKLYEGVIPSFLCNDIPAGNRCWPPEIAKKRGRHRVVRIASGSRVSRAQRSGEDVLTDSVGNLYVRYPIQDDGNLVDAMPTPSTTMSRRRRAEQGRLSKKGGPNSGKCRCSICGRTGHNKRTCKSLTPGQQEEVEVTFPVASQVVSHLDSEHEGGPHEENVVPNEEIMSNLIGMYRSVPGYEASDVDEVSEEEDWLEDFQQVRFGTTQNSQHPDWAPYLYSGNMVGIDQVANYVEQMR